MPGWLSFFFSGIGAGLVFWILSLISNRRSEKKLKKLLNNVDVLIQKLKTEIPALDDTTAMQVVQSTADFLYGAWKSSTEFVPFSKPIKPVFVGKPPELPE